MKCKSGLAAADADWIPGRAHGSQIADGRWHRDARISAEAIMGMANLPNGSPGPSTADMARQLPGSTGLSSLSRHTGMEQVLYKADCFVVYLPEVCP